MKAMTIRCPRCTTVLHTLGIGGVDTDVCENCGGLWLDRLELERFDDAAKIIGDALVAHLSQFPGPLLAPAMRLQCPRHPGVVMLRRNYSAAIVVQIDVCPECAGVWLDTDELAQIREQKASSTFDLPQ